jgi:hypothetical protein
LTDSTIDSDVTASFRAEAGVETGVVATTSVAATEKKIRSVTAPSRPTAIKTEAAIPHIFILIQNMFLSAPSARVWAAFPELVAAPDAPVAASLEDAKMEGRSVAGTAA